MLVITFKLVNHYSKDPHYMHRGVAIGYAPVVNAAVLSMYPHVTDIAMLALIAIRAVVAVVVVGLAIISALTANHKWLERYSWEWCTALVWGPNRA